MDNGGSVSWRRRLGLFGLRPRLLLLLLLTVTPLVAAFGIHIAEDRALALDEAENRALTLARHGATLQNEVVAQARTLLSILTKIPVVREGEGQECAAVLADAAGYADWRAGLSVARPDGSMECGSVPGWETANVADRAYFRRVLDTRGFVLSGYIIGKLRNTPVLVAALPLLDEHGDVSRVFMVSLDLAWVNRLVGDFGRRSGADVLLIDRNGVVLAGYPNPERWVGKPVENPGLLQAVRADRSGTVAAPGLDRSARIYGHVGLQGVDAVLAVGLPRSEVFAKADRQLSGQLVGLATVGLLVIVLAWGGGEIFLLRWIRRLSNTARLLGDGDLAARAHLPPSAGELAQLGSAMAEMSERITSREAELARASAALAESEARFRLLAEGATDMVVRIAADGRIAYVSPASTEIVGLAPEELVGNGWLGTVHPDDRQTVEGLTAKLQAGGAPMVVQYRAAHRDGHWVWVELTLRKVFGQGNGDEPETVGAIRNISRRKAIQEALQATSILQQAILEGADYAIISTSPEGEVTTFNGGAHRMLGHTAAEAVGRMAMTAFIDPAELGDRTWELSIELGVPIAHGFDALVAKPKLGTPERREWTYVGKNGRRIPVDVSVSALRDPQGNIVGFLTVAQDITERKRAEDERHSRWLELKASHAALEEQRERLAGMANELATARDAAEAASRAKSDFLASMSHELRTPLTGIIGFADLMLNGQLPIEDQRRYLTLQRDAGRSLLEIVNDVLDLSKVEAGKLELDPTDFDLPAFARSCVDLIERGAHEKGLEVNLTAGPDVPTWVTGDMMRLRQVLLNLLSNAVKFTGEGSVTLEISNVSAGPADVRLRFAVTDTGIGIPRSKQASLFQRFNQLDQSVTRIYGGTGLGLAIMKRLVMLMQGTVGLSSVPGAGSTFWFEVTLPLATAPIPHRVAANGNDLAASAIRPLRILLAEDMPANQVLVEAVLHAEGHRVTIVSDGAEALEAVQREAFDVVLMDVQMPVMDGLEAAAAIRSLRAPCRLVPIIALTAAYLPEEIERCRDAGMDGYVAKPIDRRQLLAELSNCVNGEEPTEAVEPELDPGILQMLEKQVGPGKMNELLALFWDELPTRVEAIEKAGADLAALRAEAHKLVSLAGNFGMLGLARQARLLMRACAEPHASDVTPMVAAVRAAADAAEVELDARYRRPASSG